MNYNRGIIEKLIDHFERNGWPSDLDANKVRSRATESNNDELPGFSVVKIERHRGILGSQYTKGLPMSAYETYYMCYAVHLSTLEVREQSEEIGNSYIDLSEKISEDTDSEQFSLRVRALDEISFEISEDVYHEKAMIKSLDEAEKFCETFLNRFVDFFKENLEINCGDKIIVSNHANEELVDQYRIQMKFELKKKAEQAWDNRESWDEEDV